MDNSNQVVYEMSSEGVILFTTSSNWIFFFFFFWNKIVQDLFITSSLPYFLPYAVWNKVASKCLGGSALLRFSSREVGKPFMSKLGNELAEFRHAYLTFKLG